MNNELLWMEYKRNPDVGVKQRIIMQYTNLVHYVIQRSHLISQTVVNEDDYFQIGVEGLSEAIERFDPAYGTKFETYAIPRIKGKILDELRKIHAKSMVGAKRKQFAKTFSLTEQYNDEEGSQLYELIPDDNDTPEMELDKSELRTIMIQALQQLPERERLIISLYYYESLSYKEIAELLNVTISRVSQIHSRVIEKLKLTVANYHD
ncbi:MAG: sigma-70 family RNA polymerase sigma factor [Ignavibacteriales bacterium]|nr:sigma-70 family RNA polymerase sigma factor [Ignavibacteriales bacterium]